MSEREENVLRINILYSSNGGETTKLCEFSFVHEWDFAHVMRVYQTEIETIKDLNAVEVYILMSYTTVNGEPPSRPLVFRKEVKEQLWAFLEMRMDAIDERPGGCPPAPKCDVLDILMAFECGSDMKDVIQTMCDPKFGFINAGRIELVPEFTYNVLLKTLALCE
jgi:hypothetical protein